MRVTSTTANMQYYMQLSSQQYAAAQEQVATGLRVNNPSDDPTAASQYVVSQAESANNDQYTSNVSSVLGRLQTADSSLSSIVTTMNSVITTGTEAANSTNNDSDFSGLASRLSGYLSSIIAQANTTYQGSYIFAGTESSVQPFMQAYSSYSSTNDPSSSPLTSATELTAGSVTIVGDASTGQSIEFRATDGSTVADLQSAIEDAVSAGTLSSGVTASINSSGQLEIDGSGGVAAYSNDTVLGSLSADTSTIVDNAYAYMGNSGVNQTQVGASMSVDNNVSGSSLFTTGTSILSSLKSLITAVDGGDVTDIGDAVTTVTSALSSLSAVRVKLDNNISLLDDQETFLSNEQVTLASRQSSLVGVDMTDAVTNMTQAELANNATLAAAGKTMSQTLLDYLK